jgi:hypothetical protein
MPNWKSLVCEQTNSGGSLDIHSEKFNMAAIFKMAEK